MVLAEASATDNCGDVSVIVTTSTFAGTCAGNYAFHRTFTATDDAGNASALTQIISVVDTTAPIFTLTPDALVNLDEAIGDEMPTPYVLVWDACDLAPIWSYVDVVLDVTGATTTTERTYTVVDDCENSATFVQTIVYTFCDTWMYRC